jgi:hypothetical protein
LRPNHWIIGGLALLVAALMVPVGVWAANNHPDGQAPRGLEAESRVALVFGQPSDGDDTIVGDLMIERFYAVDVETGQRMIADVAKGRIRQLQTWSRDSHGAAGYFAMLNRNGLAAEKSSLQTYIKEMAPPDPNVTYLGLGVLPGERDGMQINYDGTLPLEHMPFKAPRNWPLFDWLTYVKFNDATGPFWWPNRGYNYLLNNTEAWPYFKTLFPSVNKAVFITETIIVDMTSQPHREQYYRIIMAEPPKS